MSATRRWIATAVPGAAALLMCAVLSAPGAELSRGGAAWAVAVPGTDERLRHLHAAIEAAFQRCDVALLRDAFSRRVKTYLSSRALGVRQGYYGADQVLLMLRRGFDGRKTLRFRLGAPDDAVQQNGRRAVRARWLYRDEGASKSEARLSFTLAPEGEDWCIREIRELK
jgi:hypothetical protein